MDTNYLGSVFTSRAVIKKMKERKKGHVVYVSSIGGQVKCAISASKTTVIITSSNQRLGSAFCRICGFKQAGNFQEPQHHLQIKQINDYRSLVLF